MLFRSEVGSRVAETTVLLADDQRQRLTFAVFEPGSEHAQRAIVHPREPEPLELGSDVGQDRVVGAFTANVRRLQRDSELVVDREEVQLRDLHELAPQLEGANVAALEEHDALPGIGHGCGHNVIAAAGLGAAIGLAAVAEECGGRLRFLGTPAEEGGGGKIVMARNGALVGVDAAMKIGRAHV